MPVHDWTRVEAGIFHAFHTTWISAIQNVLNHGVLPKSYYALAEQHTGRAIADVLTLHGTSQSSESWSSSAGSSGTAVAEAPPKIRRKQTIEPESLRRTLAIRHVSGHRLIALLEIVSAANKDRAQSVQDLTDKAVDAIKAGVHVLLVDLFPPGPHDHGGLHETMLSKLRGCEETYDLPANEPLTLASYAAGRPVDLEHLAVGAPLPEMPLFLLQERYVNVPLESTYQSAWDGMPEFWREVLEGRRTG